MGGNSSVAVATDCTVAAELDHVAACQVLTEQVTKNEEITNSPDELILSVSLNPPHKQISCFPLGVFLSYLLPRQSTKRLYVTRFRTAVSYNPTAAA